MKRFLVFLVALVAFSMSAVGQNEAQSTATASAKIMTAMNLSKIQDMNFGTLSTTGTAGTVELTATSDIRYATDVTILTQNPAPSRAKFSITAAEANALYSITLPSSAIIEIEAAPSNTMALGSFVHSAGDNPTLDNVGAGEFFVGAILEVGANQVAGNYTGTFPVTVAYN